MAKGITDIYFNPSRGGTPYRTGYVDRPQQILSDRRQPNYLSTPRFVDGRIIAPDQTRALGSNMSGPDALSSRGINSLPSSGSTQAVSRMQSMGNAFGNMFAGARLDPLNPLNALQQSRTKIVPSIQFQPTQNANANRDRATMQGATNVDTGRVASEIKSGSANLGNQIMGMVSDTYSSVMGKMPSSEEVQAITKKAIDKFKSVDTRLKQTSADVSNLAVAAVRSAVQELAPSGARARTTGNTAAGTMGMDPYTADDNMPNSRGMSQYQVRGMLNKAMPREQSAGGITSLERRAMGPGMQSPTQRPPRVFMEDGSEIGSGQGRLPQPVKAVPKADAGMITGQEGAVPDGMATPLPAAKIDPTDSELNAGMDQGLDNRAPAEKTETDFANMTLVELGLNMMASDKPTVLGMLGDAGSKTLAMKAVREEKAADRKLKQDMAQIERDFRMDEGDKNRKLEKEKIDNIYEARIAEVKFRSDKLNIDKKLVDARADALRAEGIIANKMLDFQDRQLTSKDIRGDQSLFQTVWKTTSDLVIAANKDNYKLNLMEPSAAAAKLTSLVEQRLLATVGSSAARRAFTSPAFKEFIGKQSLEKFRPPGSGADFTFTKERGFIPTKAD